MSDEQKKTEETVKKPDRENADPVKKESAVQKVVRTFGKKFRGLFYNNYFLMAFSILVAFSIWMGISFSDTTTEMTRTIRGVQLEYTNLPDSVSQLGLEVIDGPSNVKQVDVTISGKQYIISQITAADLSAYIRLTDASAAGNYTAEVKAMANGKNKDFTIQNVDPQIVNVRLDRMTTKEFTLACSTNTYAAADGYTLKTPTLSDTSVMISGPATDMQQIARVVAEATVPEEINATNTYEATVHVYDEYGQEINNPMFQFSVEKTELTIVAMQLKTVPLEVAYLNAPENMSKNMVTLSPATIDISVPSDLYHSLTSLMVGTLDFSQVNTENTRFEFDINSILPSGCTNESDVDKLFVNVSMVGMRTREFDVDTIRIDSLPNDKNVEALTKSVRLTITGPASEIERITADDITVVVDMSNNPDTLGQHEIPAHIELTDGDGCWVYGSPTVFVRVSEKPEDTSSG